MTNTHIKKKKSTNEFIYEVVASLVVQREWVSRRVGSVVAALSCGTRGPVVVAHGLSSSKACGIFLEQDRTGVLCIDRQICIYTTREVLKFYL